MAFRSAQSVWNLYHLRFDPAWPEDLDSPVPKSHSFFLSFFILLLCVFRTRSFAPRHEALVGSWYVK